MSLIKPSTSESPSTPTPSSEAILSSLAGKTTVKIGLLATKQALLNRRKQLVKQRRNLLSQAAAARRKGTSDALLKHAAAQAMGLIRKADARVGLLSEAQNERSWSFEIDLYDQSLIEELGFGLDENGNYPAL